MTTRPLPPGQVASPQPGKRAQLTAVCACGHYQDLHDTDDEKDPHGGACIVWRQIEQGRLYCSCPYFHAAVRQPQPAPSAGQDTERLRDEGRCSGELCWYTLPLVDGMVVAHSKAGALEVCEGGGRPPAPAQPKLVRQLHWFTDDELRAELQRRALDGPP